MAKIIFDEDVIISQGRNLLDPAWFGIPDNYEVQMDANGDIHIKKKEAYFTGKIVVTPYIIREQASGSNKKVTENNLTSTLIVDDGKICRGLGVLRNTISAKFWRLLDNVDTRTAVEACIREEFYNGSIFRYHSGITIGWERG